MTNLADLLPAGGGQNNTDFVADGNVSAGAPVILTAAGKAAPVSESSVAETMGTQAEYGPATTKWLTSTAFDSTNNRAVFAYRNIGTPFYVRCVIGTVNGTGAMTYGTEVVVNSTTNSYPPKAVFDPNAGKAVLFYYESSNLIGIVGTVDPSDNSISFGSPVTVVSDASGSASYLTACFDTTNNQILVIYPDNVDNSSKGQVVTVSGTSLTLGTASGIGGSNDGWYDLTYDSGDDRFIFAFQDFSNSYYASAMVGRIVSSTPSFPGLVYAFDSSGGAGEITCSYDSTANKTVFAWRDGGSSNYGKAIVGTVSTWALSFGSEVTFLSDRADYIAPVYDPNANKTVIAFQDYNYPSVNNFYGRLVVGTVSGTDITFDSPQTFTNSTGASYISVAFDSTSNKVIISYIVTSTERGWGVVFQNTGTSTNLTSTNLLGLAPEAISDTATGTINTWGSRCESTKLVGEGPSAGANATYAPTPDDPYRYSMCYDTANDKVIIAYNDEANSYYLYACVGTVTGNAISWGTVVAVDETATMDQIQLTYDTNADRVLLVFRDQGTGGDLSGRVGTVSGTTISFGSKTTGTPHPSSLTSIYDPTEQKHLLSYLDNNNSNYGYSCVATVTGGATNTVAFGTQVQFSSDGNLSGDNLPMCYYTSETKIIMKYDITFTGRYAVACTISGTSVSFGTAVLEYAWGTYGQMSSTNITYDSTANKAVSVDGVNASPHGLYAAVISLSGATITWGTPVVVNANSATDTFKHAASIAYSSAGNNLLIAYSDDSNSSYLYGVSGTLSGTSTTWGTPVAVRSVSVASDQETDLIYDPDSQNFVVAYRTATPAGESNVVSIGDLPLVVGTKYYVTTSGGFSSSADTPSVNAGLAISTTSLLLNGDS